MHHCVRDGLLLFVYCLGVGASALVLCSFLTESRLGRRKGRVFAGIFTLVLPGCELALYAAGFSADACRPIMAMMLICLTAWAIDFAPSWRFTRWLAEPRLKWVFLLIVSPAYVVGLTYGLDEPPCDLMPPLCSAIEPKEVADVWLVTDRGREIKLCTVAASAQAEQLSDDWLHNDLRSQVIRTAKASPACNCHGWIFAEEDYWVLSQDVETILTDDGYQKVEEPQTGDLVIYRNVSGQIVHSGLVVDVANHDASGHDDLDNAGVEVESKWGRYGCFLHCVDSEPYGTTFDYYHSDRHGHRLQLVHLPTGDGKGAVARSTNRRQDNSGVFHPGVLGH